MDNDSVAGCRGATPAGGAPALGTYRLQLQADFTLDDAARVASYLAQLGVSHVYTSPYLQAASGSSHGYDVVDPSRVSSELGGEDARQRFCQELKRLGLSQLLDVVPNHMATIADQNPWWWDVLERGREGPHGSYFDIDWDPPESYLKDRVLLPILAQRYGTCLAAGGLKVRRAGDAVEVTYQELRLPVSSQALAWLVARTADESGSPELEGLARPSRDELSTQLTKLLAQSQGVAEAVDSALERLNQDPDSLDLFLELQHYRLVFWRAADQDLNYRRFFDITSLVGLRVEDAEVFQQRHRLLRQWVAEGVVGGLRVDHPDGLRDPAGYFGQLRELSQGLWTVGEKILEPFEELRANWGLAGTTGYDFLRLAGGIFIDQASQGAMTKLYQDFTGEGRGFSEVALETKRLVVRQSLGSDLNRMAALALEITQRHGEVRDYTRHELHQALGELAASLPVYRTYLREGESQADSADREALATAVATVLASCPAVDPQLLHFLQELLLLRIPGRQEQELVMRFQQLTGAVMAKGVEDTAFYRYHRLISLNEVGGDPGAFGVSLTEFHQQMALRQQRWPYSLNATSTHDTKRSEDVRARIHLLSEIPDRWAETATGWAELNQRHRRGDAPDRNDEYFLYQTLVGSWPISRERLLGVLEKSAREAKVHTSWREPEEEYEHGLAQFTRSILADPGFRSELEALVADLTWPGRLSSLSQTLIKLTAPGIPDIYQGTELWDNSLVDPDNRREVDFEQRRRLLGQLEEAPVDQDLARTDQGLGKLLVLRRGLGLRASRPAAFSADSSYQPLAVEGARADSLVAYLRAEQVAVLTPRLPMSLYSGWGDTRVELPPGSWHNQLTGEELSGGRLPVGSLLQVFPLALLSRTETV